MNSILKAPKCSCRKQFEPRLKMECQGNVRLKVVWFHNEVKLLQTGWPVVRTQQRGPQK